MTARSITTVMNSPRHQSTLLRYASMALSVQQAALILVRHSVHQEICAHSQKTRKFHVLDSANIKTSMEHLHAKLVFKDSSAHRLPSSAVNLKSMVSHSTARQEFSLSQSVQLDNIPSKMPPMTQLTASSAHQGISAKSSMIVD